MMKSVYAVLLTAAFVVGCSSGEDSKKASSAPRLSKKAVSVVNAQGVVFHASKKLSGVDSKYHGSSTALREVFSAVPQDDLQTKSDKLSQTLEEAKTSGRCSIVSDLPAQNERPQQDSAGNFPRFSISVKGDQCPILVETAITLEAPQADLCTDEKESTLCKFSAKVKMSFEVKDPALQNELQVVSGQMNVMIDMNQMEQFKQGNFFKPVMKNHMTADMKIVDLEGQVHVISGETKIDITISGMDMPDFGEQGPTGPVEIPMPMVKGSAKDEWNYFNDKTEEAIHLLATLVATGQQPVEKYYVNDIEVDAKTYELERESFQKSLLIDVGNMGMNEETDGSNPGMPGGPDGPNGPSEPEIPEDSFPQNPGNPPHPPTDNPVPPADPKEKWACYAHDEYTGNGIIGLGYGAVEFSAKSTAKQACQASGGRNCDNASKCAQQSFRHDAWFCEVENRSTSRVFSNEGRSIVEAQYFAMQKCLNESGDRGRFCEISDRKCVQQ